MEVPKNMDGFYMFIMENPTWMMTKGTPTN